MIQLSTTPRNVLITGGSALAGAIAAWVIGQSLPWVIVGAVVGAGTAAMIVLVGVRPIVALPVGFGAGIGAYTGGTVVGVICEPQGCAAFEASAAAITGIGALVGTGLVVALATRSFDEYRDAVDRGVDPPVTACKTEGQDESD